MSQKKKHIKQTNKESLIEQLIHTSMGMVLTFLFLYIFVPEMPIMFSIKGTVVLTLLKLVMHFYIRRYFTSKERVDE